MAKDKRRRKLSDSLAISTKKEKPLVALYKKNDFSFEHVNYYLFKHSVIFSSLLDGGTIRLDEIERIKLKKDHPIAKFFIEINDMESLFRADNIGGFFRIEQEKAAGYIHSVSFEKIESIPMPPYLPQGFFDDLDLAVRNIKRYAADERITEIEEGYEAFKSAISLLKNEVYRHLFLFLKTSDLLKQEEKKAKTGLSYLSFLKSIHGDEKLRNFCRMMEIDPTLESIKKKRIPDRKKNISSNAELKEGIDLSAFKRYFESYQDSFFKITDGENAIFAPVGFFGNFSYWNNALFSTSPTDVLLHYLPLFSEKEKEWQYNHTAKDINAFFLYKRHKALQTGIHTVSSIKDFDRKLSAARKDNENVRGNEQIREKTQELDESIYLTNIIKTEIGRFASQVRLDVLDDAVGLFGKSQFAELPERERAVAILNLIRVSAHKSKNIVPKIAHDFYVNIRNSLIKEHIIAIMHEAFKAYQEAKTEGRFDNKTKSVSAKTTASKPESAPATNESQKEKEQDYVYQEEKTGGNDKSEEDRLKEEFFS